MTEYTLVRQDNPMVDGVEVTMDIRTRIYRVEGADFTGSSDWTKAQWRDKADAMAYEALGFDGALCGAFLKQNSKGVWYLKTIEA